MIIVETENFTVHSTTGGIIINCNESVSDTLLQGEEAVELEAELARADNDVVDLLCAEYFGHRS